MEDQKNIAAGTAPDADDEIDLVELSPSGCGGCLWCW